MMCFLSRKWKTPRVILGLIIAEFPLTIACLTLSGIAAPNLYRNLLWQTGGDLGFNSKPNAIVYAAANYRPVATPLVWSQFATNFNLVVSVLSMFLLLTKMTMHITSTWYPIFSLIVHGVLVALWAVSIHAQTAPDTIDPRHVNNGVPWYLSKSCNLSPTNEIKGYCMQAKAFFAVSIISLVLFAVHFFLATWSAIPTAEQKAARRTKIEEKKMFSPESNMSSEEMWQHQWEMGTIPPTPGLKAPYTPRTQAFHNLGGMDEVIQQNPNQSGSHFMEQSNTSSQGLPLRERYGNYYQ